MSWSSTHRVVATPIVEAVGPRTATADARVPQRLRILLINQYFPPDTSATANIFQDLVGTLADAGHDITVVCGRPSYRPTERYPWRLLRREQRGPITVIRVGSAASARTSLRQRLPNYVSYLVLATAYASLKRRADVVVAGSDPPLAALAGLVAARGRPLVYHLQDLHPEAALSAGWLAEGRIAVAWERLHRFVLRRARMVVCLGDSMAAVVRAKGVAASRVAVVQNGASAPAEDDDPDLHRRIRGSSSFVVVHAGNIGDAGPWRAIAGAADLLDETEFVFVGDGAREREVRSAGLRVEPYTTQIRTVMRAGDLQLVALREDMEGLIVPSKLYTALAHGRPVLAVVPPTSEVASTVRQWKCGVVADPNDPEGIARAVRTLSSDPGQLAAMEGNARRAAARFDRARLFAGLAARIETVAHGVRAGG